MIKLLIKIFKDERGILPLLAAGGALIGGGIGIDSIWGKDKERVLDPYSKLRDQYKGYLGGKLGTTTPYEYNPAFNIDQPDIEKATEASILGKLQNPDYLKSDIMGIGKQYRDAQKAQMEERHAEEARKTGEIYNRLGLVSSTPGTQAQSDLMRKQGQEFNVMEANVAQQGIQDEMAAMELSNAILNAYQNQGQTLGRTQRESQMYSQEMSMADIQRMINEELGYAGLANSLLGANPPEVSYEGNWARKLGPALTKLGGQVVGSAI